MVATSRWYFSPHCPLLSSSVHSCNNQVMKWNQIHELSSQSLQLYPKCHDLPTIKILTGYNHIQELKPGGTLTLHHHDQFLMKSNYHPNSLVSQIRTSHKVLVQRCSFEVCTTVKSHPYFPKLVRMIYPMMRNVPRPPISWFFC